MDELEDEFVNSEASNTEETKLYGKIKCYYCGKFVAHKDVVSKLDHVDWEDNHHEYIELCRKCYE